MSIERSGIKGTYRYRAVVRHKGVKKHGPWVNTEGLAKDQEAQIRIEMGGSPIKGGHTVAEVVTGYLVDSAARLSPGTVGYYRKGEKLIPPKFGARLVSDVNPVLLDALYRELRQGGASEHKIKKVHAVLSASFNRALRYGWCVSNPCASATKPKVKSAEIVPPTPEEVRAVVLSAMEVNPDLSVCLRLAAATGMRRSELVGLQWRDISGVQVTVRRSIVEDKAGLHERATKTGSRGHRTIKVDEATLALMGDVHARQRERCNASAIPEPDWCFTHDDLETPWRPDYLTTAYARLARHSTLHGLRHFHATQLLAAGVTVAQVSHRLGHSSPAVTLNTYSHWIPAQDQQAADIIGSLLYDPPEPAS